MAGRHSRVGNPRKARRLSTVIAGSIAISVVASIGVVPASADLQPATITINYVSPATFSPNGDGQEDSSSIGFCLDNPANVTAVASDSTGNHIRTFAYTVSYPSGCSYDVWDGRNDAGALVADGAYTVKLSAVNASGTPTTASVSLVVDRRLPGNVTSPSPGNTVTGTTSFVFTPTAGITVTQAYFSVSAPGGSCGSNWISTADGAGNFVWSTDTTSCGDGAGQVTATVYWTDSFGQSQNYSTPAVAVTLSNPSAPVTSVLQVSPQTFSPNGDAQVDTSTIYYCVTDTGASSQTEHVLVRVLNGAGNSVRTLVDQDLNPNPGYCALYYGNYRYVQWDGLDDNAKPVADGAYTISVQATDATNLTGSSTNPIVVDNRLPGTLTTPTAGDTLTGTQQFVFTPTPGITVTQAYFTLYQPSHYQSFGIFNASPDGKWRTTLPVGSFSQGAADLNWSASWNDAYGQPHTYSGRLQLAIDPTAVPLVVDPTITTGNAPFDARLTVTTSDPNSQSITLYTDWGDGSTPTSQQVTAPYDPILLTHQYTQPGTFSAFVSVSNGQGGYAAQNTPIVANGKPNTPPTVAVTPSFTSGTAPLGTDFAIVASDPDNDALTYKIDFGDGSNAEQGSVTANPVHHVYSLPGLYTARIEVTDGKAGVVRYQRISVVLPEPLTANAGDDQQAVTAQNVTFDGSASRPSQVISSYEWDFGDGTTGTGRSLTHAFSTAGNYTIKLTTRIGAEAATDTATVTVTAPPAEPGLFVHVTSTGAPLAGADLTVVQPDGSRISGITGPDGVGKLAGLPDGETTVYVWADGYTPAVVKATVSGGRGDVNIELTSGNVGATTLDYKRLTRDQIVAKGIDPSDPANQNVFEATINLFFIPANAPSNYTPPPSAGSCTPDLIFNNVGKVLGLSGCGLGAGGGVGGGGGGGGCDVTDPTQGCFILNGTFAVWPTVHYVQSQPVIQWLVIPVKASFLKEFFDVQMVVQNLAPAGFTFTGGDAGLTLPSGLSLAPTSSPQSLDVPLPDIGGGQSQSATWTVRGDTEGDYNLTSIYTAVVQPVDQPISLTAHSIKPLHVYGGSALKMTVIVDSCAVRFGPYAVDVALTNTTSDAPVYNAQVELKDRPADAPSWQALYSIGSPHVQGTASIPPAGTFTAHYIVYPALGNDDVTKLQLVPESSFIQRTGGNVSLATSLDVHSKGDCAKLNYYSVTTAPATKNTDPKAPDTATVMWQQPAEYNLSDIDYYEVLGTSALDRPLATTRFAHVAPDSPCASDQLFIAGYPCITINSNDDREMRYITVVTHLKDGRALNLHLLGQGPARYVALGDSFSSGEGYPPFEPGSDTGNLAQGQASDNCHRSMGSYSRQLSQDISRRNDFLPASFAACSGAITDDYVHQNLTNHEAPQASQVSKFTDRVTLTMGGNDAGFKWFVVACSLLDNCGGVPPGSTGAWYSTDSIKTGLNQLANKLGCISLKDLISGNPGASTYICVLIESAIDGLAQGGDPADPRSQGVNNLPDPNDPNFPNVSSTLGNRLDDLYSSLLRDAPNAEVYVANYPVAVDDSPAPCELRPDLGLQLVATGVQSPTLTATEKNTIRALTNNLDGVIGNEVAKYAQSGRLHLVDVRSNFTGHELCGGPGLRAEGVRGFNSLVLPGEICGNSADGIPGMLDATACSIHPNDIGQKAYADAFANAIPATLRSSGTIRPGQVLVAGTVIVSPGNSLNASSQWPGSDVGLVLVSPSGIEYSRGQTAPGSSWDVTPTSETVSMPNAEPGVWTVHTRGISVADAGETVKVFASSNASPPAVPTAVGTIERASIDGRTIHVSAAGSSSTTGGISSYTWFFSDGTVATGRELDHRFAVPGVYSTKLLVTDQAGQTASSVVGDYVTPNQAPVAHDDSFDCSTGAALVVPASGLLENDIDAEGDALTAELVTVPDHGVVDVHTDGSFTYTPSDGFVGVDSFTYRASDGAVSSATATVSLHVSQPTGSALAPSFTHADPPLLTLVGAAYLSTFTATGSPLPEIALESGSLPPGLTLSSAGALSGVPSLTGIFTFSIKATNTSGTAISGPFTVTVAEAPVITSATPATDGSVGTRYAFSFSATGFPAPSFSISAGTLPEGVSLDSNGMLNGTPTTPGTHTFSVAASNQVGVATAGPFTITVSQKPAFTVASPPTTAVVGDPYQYQFTATGSPSPVVLLAGGTLPDGLTVTSDGQITGTPTASGTFTFSVTATNDVGGATAGPFTIIIAQRPTFTTFNPATSAVVGTPYEYQFATNGSPVPTLTVDGGTLPDGLVLSPSGSVTGTPTAPGQFTFSVKAINDVGSTTVGPFAIDVYQAPAFTSGSPTAYATVGTAYSFDFGTSGSPAPTIVISGGALPGGLLLSTTGALRGSPTQTGTFQFTVSASNQAGSTSAGPFTISVNEAPSFTSGTPPTGAVNTPYSFTFTASGAPAPTFFVASGSLPPGLTLAPDGTLAGSPTNSGTFSFSVAATNSVATVTAGDFGLVVTSSNHVPSAVSQSLSMSAGASLPVTLSGIDPDGDPLTYAVTVAPSHGRLTGTAPNLVYSPTPGYTGADTFDFTVSDGHSVSAPAIVSISVISTTIVNLTLPNVAGTTKVGETLMAAAGGWSPSGVTFTYQWLRNGAVVRSATGATYIAKPSDVGARYSVRVTASISGYKSVSATSASTAPITLGTIAVASVPMISGTTKVGATLTSSTGTWSQSGLRYFYGWLRDGRGIVGAARNNYRLTSADAGHTISVRVTVSKVGYLPATASSTETTVVLR